MSLSKFAIIDEIILHYQVEGSSQATPLVFINSLGSDLRIWDAVAAHFVDHYTIVRYDKRGHGLSDSPPGPYTIQQHADDLAGLLDHLGIKHAILCGISVGGMIALAFATSHPQRTHRLVLCDTGMTIGNAQTWNDRIVAIRANGLESIAPTVLARWLTPAFAEHYPAAYRGYGNMLARSPASGYIATCEAIRDADLTAAAPTIQTPALVLCGSEDQSTSPDLNRTLAQTLPNARFVLIDKAAHLPCIEQPEVVVGEMERFLGEVA